MTRGSRFEKKTKERLCHLVLLAKNNQGYHNLIKIVSKGFVDGENNYHRPRVDFDLLEQYHEGLMLRRPASKVRSRRISSTTTNRAPDAPSTSWSRFSARKTSI